MSIFENDTTKDLRDMLADTFKKRRELEDEIDSCNDCIEDIDAELLERG